ncbi:hypothetical protein OPV22_002561 [Ensete ventricosum]|uniref:Uncharacterized protein n=1 Tax=Ensete ventricosum TaxID=4639 RepID=A0AAV8RY62_ENSVE|nr:hypothetical protein OPV22_002561 [Ensete ventricosum]
MRTHGRPASAVLWHSLLESTALLVVALFTEVELPVAPDHSHDHVPLHGTHWYLHLDFFLDGTQPPYADDQGFHPMQASMHTHGRTASAVLWHSLLESTALLAVALFTEVELPVAPDHSHDHVPLHGTHWYLHLDFFLDGTQPPYADDQGFHPMQASMHTHGRTASAVLWHSLLESTALLAVALFTEVELPVAPDHTSA